MASERGTGQWSVEVKQNGLESPAIAGDSPVGEMILNALGRIPEYHGTREILWEAGKTIFQG